MVLFSIGWKEKSLEETRHTFLHKKLAKTTRKNQQIDRNKWVDKESRTGRSETRKKNRGRTRGVTIRRVSGSGNLWETTESTLIPSVRSLAIFATLLLVVERRTRQVSTFGGSNYILPAHSLIFSTENGFWAVSASMGRLGMVWKGTPNVQHQSTGSNGHPGCIWWPEI